jgi:hypothetical protein
MGKLRTVGGAVVVSCRARAGGVARAAGTVERMEIPRPTRGREMPLGAPRSHVPRSPQRIIDGARS